MLNRYFVFQLKNFNEQSINSPPIKRKKTKSTEPTPSTSKSIRDSLEEFLQSSSGEETHALPKDVVQMIENYHQEKRLDSNDDPISWWKVNKNVYPRLSKLGRKTSIRTVY